MNIKIKLIAVGFILSIILFSACTVEKRSYRKGYYVNWHHSSNKAKENIRVATSEKQSKQQKTEIKTEPVFASTSEQPALSEKSIQRKTIFADDECGDLMTMRNGEEVKAKIIEISEKEIKYKRCDNLDGPLITVNKNDVFMIKYANGTKEVFKQTSPGKENGNKNNPNTKKPPSGPAATDLSNGPWLHPFAVASFVSLIFSATLIGPIIGIVFGALALRKIKAEPEKFKGKGAAIAGIILCAVVLIFVLLYISGAFFI